LMGMFYSGQYEAMMPKLKSKNFEGMELIRPLYYVREENIIKWANYNDLKFLKCACRFTEEAEKDPENDRSVTESISKRKRVRELIAALKKENPYIEDNIFAAMSNVTLNKLPGYKIGKEKHSFLEYYDSDSPLD
ncbi:MAG: ATPase, partial [Lachnospiraceae bacterium]|nr:ATPase [Lachnospiraceae bacterium]